MNTILYSSGTLSLSYSSVILAFAAAACFCMTWSLFRARGGRGVTLCLFLPLSVVFSVFLSRILHWYCHTEQYSSFFSALTDFRTGGFVLTGVLFSILLSDLFLSLFPFHSEIPVLLDCLSPGTVILFIFIRLSALFNSSCRSKIAVTAPSLQRLPFAAEILDAAGNTEYRFATFFAEAVILGILLIALLIFYARHASIAENTSRRTSGDVWLMFLNWYSAIEVLSDSTRYDSSLPVSTASSAWFRPHAVFLCSLYLSLPVSVPYGQKVFVLGTSWSGFSGFFHSAVPALVNIWSSATEIGISPVMLLWLSG